MPAYCRTAFRSGFFPFSQGSSSWTLHLGSSTSFQVSNPNSPNLFDHNRPVLWRKLSTIGWTKLRFPTTSSSKLTHFIDWKRTYHRWSLEQMFRWDASAKCSSCHMGSQTSYSRKGEWSKGGFFWAISSQQTLTLSIFLLQVSV